MTAIAIAGGVRVDAPAGMGVAAVAPTRAGAADPMVRALSDPEMSVVVSAALSPPAPTRGARRRPEPATVAVDVGPGERAVLLMERDGVYEWVMPDEERLRPPTRGDAGGAELVFTVAPGGPAAPTRGLLSAATAAVMHVLRFPAHLVGSLAIRHLERNVRTGMVSVTGEALSAWRRTDRAPRFPKSRPARVLLLVHGTFSSTIGGFGGLTRTPEGRAMLAAARKDYDAILGYNHRTLSVDPFDNAQEYLDMLLGLDAPKGIRIDAMAHSRGGLTVRSLIEHLLPAHPSIVVEKAILVACTNGGTQLARPANWKALLDVYTNVAIAGATIGGGVVAPILSGALTGVSALAKYLVTSSVGEAEAIPGLAAMNPDGAFVATINQVQPGEPTKEGIVYDILTSDYEPIGAAGDGVAAKLNKALKDAAVDRLMRGVENDGVVDVGGMRKIGPTTGYVDDELHFTATEGVNHSGYFVNPQAVRRMAAWLGQGGDAPARGRRRTAAATPRARSRAAKPAPPATAAWTVMVFQAGFNSLNEFAVKDLKEMQAARLDPAVRLAVFQCRDDDDGERVAFQTLVGSSGALDDRTELEGADSGRPGTVLDFARWAIERAPAERYALVLWSHGNGWEPEDFDELYTSSSGRPLARGSLRAGAAARRTLFLDSAAALVKDPDKRNILVDDGTGHSLDTLELAHVVKQIRAAAGRPLDLLGMDACLMNCVEIAYELRNDVRAIVGSQEEEPGDGWPYTAVLGDLSREPSLGGAEWADRIAARYVSSYSRSGEHVTQSVLDLTKVRSLTTPVKALATALAAACARGATGRRSVRLAVMDTLSFPRNSGTQVDLLGLCAVLRQSGLGAAVDRACDRVTAALAPGGVVAARHSSRGAMAAAGGISIYLPADPGLVSEEYGRLAFARAGGWGALLKAVHPG